ncbi:MAG TPA: 1-deoxy-D-xylulose-5-phosphate reductoisomerase, partial [Clostridia bacterium]|nr:1-deoxy-D-xylulose-5-phosphate reductoisomerase [Clostridia bacterium]
KESIVCANVLIKKLIIESSAKILPVDSEMSAIFQCLQNGKETELTSLILTASGGPFLKMKQEALALVTPLQALKHPIWSMGAKISVDSATMFNKGLELIEASNLFNMQSNHISVLIHPQSIVHSMVEYIDGSVIAQLAVPDMRLAIQYALGYPNRLKRQVKRLSLAELGSLTFYDAEAVPAIRLARRALNEGGVQPIVYNAANDIGVELFMQERIGFLDICKIVEDAMDNTPKGAANTLEEIMFIDTQVRRQVLDRACKLI